MRIAVISDTHDRLPGQLVGAIAAADEIWHLGDVTQESLLHQIRQIGPSALVVRGNCDSHLHWPLELSLRREGFRIRLVHIPPASAPAGIDLLLHGHTHVPRNEVLGGVRFLNPGCITRPNRGSPASFAWLELTKGAPLNWRLIPLQTLQ